jgi:hypothetical protein
LLLSCLLKTTLFVPMASYTPAFQWALPDQNDPSINKKPSPATTKPIANPLLKQSFSQSPTTAASSLRVPFSPVENHGLRQRRQQEVPKNTTVMPAIGKRPVRPPTASLFDGVVNEVRPTTTMFETSETVPQLVNDSLERWVVVYGYSTEAQFQAILRKFESFGKIVSHRGSGRSNWIALEYDSVVQAEKALCQQNCLLLDDILVGVTRLTMSLKQSLDWNAPTASAPLSVLPDVRLCDRFENSNNNNNNNNMMKEEDILLFSSPKKKQSLVVGGANGNVCERFLSWWFGWA